MAKSSVKKSTSAPKRVKVKDLPAETKLTARQMKKVKGGGLINQKGALVSLGGNNT
ncbi:MAG TPA: hypothetical protein VMS31_09125 [Pyrinomonadaceae bacterium]|nr:hypothetical protein [Pyrinomonadaceae bacterium]